MDYFSGSNISIKSQPKLKEVKGKKDKKGKEKNLSKLSSMGKDETVTIMHGVGRVLNPKS